MAAYKITNEASLKEIEYLQHHLGFKIHYNSAIDSPTKIKNLEEDFDAIFLGVGLGKTRNLVIQNQNISGVIGAVEFIEDLKLNGPAIEVPSPVVVIGGGNTAMDAASACTRLGANVTLVYRRSVNEMGAYAFEYELAIESGARAMFNYTPTAIIGDQHIETVKFIKTQSQNGQLETIPDSEIELPCALLILATGQENRSHLYHMIEQLTLNQKGQIIVNKDYQTTNPKYFAGGDAINGGAEVVHAAYDGKMAALSIDAFISASNKS